MSEEPGNFIIKNIRHWASVSPNKKAIRYCDNHGREVVSYSYNQLNQVTYRLSTVLIDKWRLNVGDRVILVYPPCIDFLIVFLSCIRAGVVPVPVYPPYPTGVRKNVHLFAGIQKNCCASAVLCNNEYMRIKRIADAKNMFTLMSSEWPSMTWRVTDSYVTNITPCPVPDDEPALHFPSSSLCFLQYTSGSTSFPKGVMITLANLRNNMDTIIRSLHADTSAVVVSWLPQYHDMGLIGSSLCLLYCGGSGIYFSPISFISDPCLWLLLISRYQATHIQGPNFGYALVLRKMPLCSYHSMFDLHSLRHIFNAAEPIAPQVMRDFVHDCAPYGLHPEALVGGFGLAECCVYVSDGGHTILSIEKEPFESCNEVVCVKEESLLSDSSGKKSSLPTAEPIAELFSCGDVTKNENIRIVIARDGVVCSDDLVGRIYIQSPSVASGYYPDNKESFTATLQDQQGFWLDTGDLGFIHKNELYVCGRAKDLLIIRGKNYYPQDIEQSCCKVPQVKPGAVAAIPIDYQGQESLVVVLELRNAMDDYMAVIQQLRQVISEENGLVPFEIVIIQPKTIAKTTSGKISRHRVALAYKSETLQVVYRIQLQSQESEQEGSETTTEPLVEMDNLHSQLPSVLDKLDTLSLHGEALQNALLEDICYICGVQSYMVTPNDSLEMMNLDSMRRAQLQGILEQNYGASVDPEMLYNVNTTFMQLFEAVDMMNDRKPVVRNLVIQQTDDATQPLIENGKNLFGKVLLYNSFHCLLYTLYKFTMEGESTPGPSEKAQVSNQSGKDNQNKDLNKCGDEGNKPDQISVFVVESPILDVVNQDAIKTLTTELRSIKSSLQSWRKSRRQEVGGHRYVPAPFVIINHSYNVAPTNGPTPFVSYHNSPELNALIVQNKKQ